MKSELCVFNAVTMDREGNFCGDLPKICPYCKISIMSEHLNSYLTKKPLPYSNEFVYSMFLCPNCYSIFLAEYKVNESKISLLRVYPQTCQETVFSENISELSPSFCKIYNEASSAEQQGMLEICGMGYRKALEFLIKDYAIKNEPNESEAVKNKMLGKCIEEHISNPKIKTLAKASAWLGNDETHYVRKIEDYDLKDLKSLISAIVAFIEMELEVAKAESIISN